MLPPATVEKSKLARPEAEGPAVDAAQKSSSRAMPDALFLRRHSRLLRVASILEADGTTDPETLARELGIGRRTLYRDLDLLRRAGVKLEYCREERRYRLDSLYMRLALGLTQDEAASILRWSARRAKRRAGQPVGPLDRALSKIGRILTDGLKASKQEEHPT